MNVLYLTVNATGKVYDLDGFYESSLSKGKYIILPNSIKMASCFPVTFLTASILKSLSLKHRNTKPLYKTAINDIKLTDQVPCFDQQR